MGNRPVTIIGGGLAGLSLGLGLRKQAVPVTVWEAGRYPRHRVCGEFVSGRGQDVLARLGLRERFLQAGAIPARTAAFHLGKASSPARPLPSPALSLSRRTMDAVLAEEFRRCGGELQEGERRRDETFGEGVVRATGRRPDRHGGWFGLKAHARNVRLSADLEMHALPNGYLGVSRLTDAEVNICGLLRPERRAGAAASSWREVLRGPLGSVLRRQMADAVFDENSFCSVAGISLRPHRAAAQPDFCVGDALTMIPPVTGNGMSMAFEAAELATAPLAAWSRGEITWGAAQQAAARACDDAFRRRLAWARMLHWMMLAPVLRGAFGALPLHSTWFWHLMFARTR